jgi:hypothetical protein
MFRSVLLENYKFLQIKSILLLKLRLHFLNNGVKRVLCLSRKVLVWGENLQNFGFDREHEKPLIDFFLNDVSQV